MEDPVAFDVWAKVVTSSRVEAVKELSSLRHSLNEAAIRTLVNGSIVKDEPVRVAEDKGWCLVETLRRVSLGWLKEIQVYQRGYTPANKTNYCSVHKFHYGGCVGCHVCAASFVP